MSGLGRREFLAATAAGAVAASCTASAAADECGKVDFIDVPLAVVPPPKPIAFRVRYRGNELTLRGHYWYNAPAMKAGKRLPAIVELNPYRCRDGMLYVDSMMYPYFALREYVCIRVDLHGSGDSDGVMTDEYTDEELASCVQVIDAVAKLPFCDGNVGMMGKSWSAINSLMVAARPDCPSALKAIVFCCGTDDRFDDDVHYMGGTMMYDQPSWAASMWGWLPMPPDPAIVGDRWREMWRERVRGLNFWFEPWAEHQTRDDYWSRTSVRERYADVKVPVFVLSGWMDGYKNPAERAVRALGALGKPVAGILGPWGHKYPFDGYPGPRVDWLRYIVPHWWDRWLKGRAPDAQTAWPQLPIFLGSSQEPSRIPNADAPGTWVAEDHAWESRTLPIAYALESAHRLERQPSEPQASAIASTAVVDTAMLESTSWGECDNDDLPGDQRAPDRAGWYFDTQPLDADVACFGYPRAVLDLACTNRPAAINVRLCEISPQTGASHLVVYRFWNLSYTRGELAGPQAAAPGRFTLEIPLNVMGHVFSKGWKIRLAISPVWVPTMWRPAERYDVTLHCGAGSSSRLILPGRPPRDDDARAAALLPAATVHVDPERYAPILRTVRDERNARYARAETVGGAPALAVHKLMDAGSYVYGGILDRLLVDSTATEDFVTLDGAPASSVMQARYESKLERGAWRVRAVTHSRVWTERSPDGGYAFRYEADVETYVGDEPFESNRVTGSIPRRWV